MTSRLGRRLSDADRRRSHTVDPMPHGEEGGGKAMGKGRDIKGERGPSKHRERQVHLASSCPWNAHEVQGEKSGRERAFSWKMSLSYRQSPGITRKYLDHTTHHSSHNTGYQWSGEEV